MKKIIKILFVILPAIIGTFSIFKLHEILPKEDAKISFLDVGQGDAIYIRTPNGHDLLIDGGPDESVIRALSKAMPKTDKKIEALIMTHSDSDHSSGLISVLERYEVEKLFISGATSSSAIRSELDHTANARGVYIKELKEGDLISFEDELDFNLAVLSPNIDPQSAVPKDSNDLSLVLRLTFGSSSVMLLGDAGKIIEQEIIEKYTEKAIASTILKVGHHGSNTSSDQNFVELVNPTYSIISAGRENRYGHPHKDVIETLTHFSSTTILQTKNEGNITFVFDREKIKSVNGRAISGI